MSIDFTNPTKQILKDFLLEDGLKCETFKDAVNLINSKYINNLVCEDETFIQTHVDELKNFYDNHKFCEIQSQGLIVQNYLQDSLKEYLNELCPDGYSDDYEFMKYSSSIKDALNKEKIPAGTKITSFNVNAHNAYCDLVDEAIHNILYEQLEDVVEKGETEISEALEEAKRNPLDLHTISNQEAVTFLFLCDHPKSFQYFIEDYVNSKSNLNPFNFLNDNVKEIAYEDAFNFVSKRVKDLGIEKLNRDTLEELSDTEITINQLHRVGDYKYTIEWSGDIIPELKGLSATKYEKVFDSDKISFKEVKSKQNDFLILTGKESELVPDCNKYKHNSIRDTLSGIQYQCRKLQCEKGVLGIYNDNVKIIPMIKCKVNGKEWDYSDLSEEMRIRIFEDIITGKSSGKFEVTPDMVPLKCNLNDMKIVVIPTKNAGFYSVEISPSDWLEEGEKEIPSFSFKIETHSFNRYALLTESENKARDYLKALLHDMTYEEYKEMKKLGKDSFFDLPKEIMGSLNFTVSFKSVSSIEYYKYINPDKLSLADFKSMNGQKIKPCYFNKKTFSTFLDCFKKEISHDPFTYPVYFCHSLSKYGENYEPIYKSVTLIPEIKDKIIKKAWELYPTNLDVEKNIVAVDLTDILKEKAEHLLFSDVTVYDDGIVTGVIGDSSYSINFEWDVADGSIVYHNYDLDSYNYNKEMYTKENPLPHAFESSVHMDILEKQIDSFCVSMIKSFDLDESLDDKIAAAEERVSESKKETKAHDDIEL